jgi:hypothetical protein
VKDIAIYVRWRDFVGIIVLAVVVLLVAGAVRGGPLRSSAAQVALPFGGLLCAGALAYIKQCYRTWNTTALRPLAREPSHERTSLRFFVTGFCHSLRWLIGFHRRPRHDGEQLQRAFSSAKAAQRRWCATYTFGVLVFRQLAISEP